MPLDPLPSLVGENALLAVLTLAGGILLHYYAHDIFRFAKFTAYKCGYASDGNKGIIPGPMIDTRFLRFSDGLKMASSFRREFGPTYRVFCGSIPEIVITDPDDVRAFYHDAKDHSKATNIGFGEFIGKILGHCVGIKHNEDWRRLRSHIDGHFTISIASELLPSMISDVFDWLATIPPLETSAFRKNQNKIQVQAHEVVSPRLLLTMIARILFGDLVNSKLIDELCQFYSVHKRLMDHAFFGKIEQWALAAYLPTKANREAEDFLQGWSNFMHHIAQEAEANGIPTATSELYKRMLAGDMSFLEFSHSVDEILFNNIDVTNNAISWAIILLAQHSEVQDRLVEEIKVALQGPSPADSPFSRMEAYLRRTNTLLHYCCLEAGRLQPTSFYSLPELTSENKILGGYLIPAQTSVIVDVYTLNRRSPVWQNDGDSFRPDRFATLQPAQYRYAYLRFGFGPRKCVGQHFGDKIVKSTLAGFIARYNVSIQGDAGMLDKCFLNTPAATLTLEPRVSPVF